MRQVGGSVGGPTVPLLERLAQRDLAVGVLPVVLVTEVFDQHDDGLDLVALRVLAPGSHPGHEHDDGEVLSLGLDEALEGAPVVEERPESEPRGLPGHRGRQELGRHHILGHEEVFLPVVIFSLPVSEARYI